MAVKQSSDKFANMAIVSVTESAANTLTFKKLETGIALFDKMAWVISRVEYLATTPLATVFDATADSLGFGVSVSNAFAVPALTEVTILDYNNISRMDFGTAANTIIWTRPVTKDFSAMPGGGLIVPPVPFYLWALGSSLTVASTIVARVWYTNLILSPDDYWELVEARRVLSS